MRTSRPAAVQWTGAEVDSQMIAKTATFDFLPTTAPISGGRPAVAPHRTIACLVKRP
jgi:hypothetical protein